MLDFFCSVLCFYADKPSKILPNFHCFWLERRAETERNIVKTFEVLAWKLQRKKHDFKPENKRKTAEIRKNFVLKTNEKSSCGKKHKKFPQKPLILQGFLPEKNSAEHQNGGFGLGVQKKFFWEAGARKVPELFVRLRKEEKKNSIWKSSENFS